MHHVRGLARRTYDPLVKKLEKAAFCETTGAQLSECLHQIQLIDVQGAKRGATLILTPVFLNQLKKTSPDKELALLKDLRRIYVEETHKSLSFFDNRPNERSLLYVKGNVDDAYEKLYQRQALLLSRLEGKVSAHDKTSVRSLVGRLLKASDSYQSLTLEEIAQFRGFLHELCILNPDAVRELSREVKIPFCGAQLAPVVDISNESAVRSFLNQMDIFEKSIPGFQTSATSLAIRMEKQSVSQKTSDQVLSLCRIYNVDPGSVYSHDAEKIQQWSNHYFNFSDLPDERRAKIMQVVKKRKLLPRRVSMSALSIWCGSDLESEWAEYNVSCALLNDEKKSFSALAVDTAHRASENLLLKDPKRNLVDNHLLHIYAELLKQGKISALDSSFSSFIDCCGDCHSVSQRPSTLQFTITASSQRQCSIYETLLSIAPQSSFWTSLLAHSSSSFEVRQAPCDELCVTLTLPNCHECASALESRQVRKKMDDISVIFEDDDIVVFNKPSGLATTRHALSCSQACDPFVTDLVSFTLAQYPQTCLVDLPRNGLVHRLDAETSGCIVWAKSLKAVHSLRHQFGTAATLRCHSSKIYLALCVVLENDLSKISLSGRVDDPLDSKIQTRYRILQFFSTHRVALVECRLRQGKKHQIRRHMASLGLPLVGDVVHGGAACVQPFLRRTALHASALTIIHPTTGEQLLFSAPLPFDFRIALASLNKGK